MQDALWSLLAAGVENNSLVKKKTQISWRFCEWCELSGGSESSEFRGVTGFVCSVTFHLAGCC